MGELRPLSAAWRVASCDGCGAAVQGRDCDYCGRPHPDRWSCTPAAPIAAGAGRFAPGMLVSPGVIPLTYGMTFGEGARIPAAGLSGKKTWR